MGYWGPNVDFVFSRKPNILQLWSITSCIHKTFFVRLEFAYPATVPYYTPLKSKIDTQNSHVWKEIHFPKPSLLVSMLDFGGVFATGIGLFFSWQFNNFVFQLARGLGLVKCIRMTGSFSFIPMWFQSQSTQNTIDHHHILGGGFKHVLFLTPGEMIQFDEHIFSDGLVQNHQLVLYYNPLPSKTYHGTLFKMDHVNESPRNLCFTWASVLKITSKESWKSLSMEEVFSTCFFARVYSEVLKKSLILRPQDS